MRLNDRTSVPSSSCALHLDPVVEISARYLARRFGQRLNRHGHLLGEEQRHPRGREQQQQRDQQQRQQDFALVRPQILFLPRVGLVCVSISK